MVGLANIGQDTELIAFILEVTKEAIAIQFSNANAANEDTVGEFDILMTGYRSEAQGRDTAIDLYLDVSTNDESVYNKIENALASNYGDIVAYIMQQLRVYFADSSHGYDDVDADSLTVEITGISEDSDTSTTSAPQQDAISFLLSNWIYACALGGVLLLICCGGVLICCCKRKKDKNAVNMRDVEMSQKPGIQMMQSTSTTCENAETSPTSIISGTSVQPSQAIQRVHSAAEDSDSEDLGEIQQTIHENQQKWVEFQIQQKHVQSPPPNPVQMMNSNMNMYAPPFSPMQAQQMQHPYMQQQHYMQQAQMNNAMQQQYMNRMMMQQQAPQQAAFVGGLPQPPSQVELPAHYTARLSLDPNGVDKLLHVDERGEHDAYVEGADVYDEPEHADDDTDGDDSSGNDDLYGRAIDRNHTSGQM